MRINFTLLWSTLGGGTNILFRLANELVDRGHEVSLITMGTEKDIEWAAFKGKVICIPIPIHERLIRKYNKLVYHDPDFRNFFYLHAMGKLVKHMPECDINVATYALTAPSVVLSGKGKPFYYMQHYEPVTYADPLFSKMAEMSYFLPLQKIANSTWLRDQIKEQLHIDVSNINVVSSAVDTDVFYPRKENRFSKEKNKKRVVCMGKAEDWKGFKDALESMKIVFQKRNDVEFFVYALKDNLIKDPNVPYTILTNIKGESLAELLSSADLVIIPSWFESSPLPGLEAMACGAALLTTCYGTEDFAVNNENALVVSPRQPQELANAILAILNDESLRRRLIENGFKTIPQFTWPITVNKIEGIFKNA